MSKNEEMHVIKHALTDPSMICSEEGDHMAAKDND